ncbi:unnamed protein product [Diatraea saccharalis]|uniref:BED-type domain-containing protein n=1 Tax=Diatraea saccharalis TaxID=40085 RepID=A0A9N9N2C3_9NEOP|nr:unnamed protein product [Diatraea saccharalis]
MPPPRKRSAVWSHFTECENKKAKCVYCAQILTMPSGNVCNLGRHLKNKHPTVPLVVERQPVPSAENEVPGCSGMSAPPLPQPGCSSSSLPPCLEIQTTSTPTIVSAVQPRVASITDFIQSNKPIPARRAEILDEQLITMIAREYHPLKLVEDVEFKKFVGMLCPGYTLPTRKTLSESLLPKLYEKVLEATKKKIEKAEAVCLATDGWTSINNDSFIAVMAHFLSDQQRTLKMESVLLGCIEYNARHTSSNLCQFLKNMAVEWDIQNKITAVATDNAANITAAVREGEWRQIHCFAHTVNLCVQAAIKQIAPTIAKAKAVVEYFKRSSHAQAKLREMQKQLELPPLKLKQDVSTRWNSTFDMISRLTEIKTAVITTLALLSPQHALDENDWSLMEHAIPILKVFADITTEISAEKNVTLSKVIPLCKLISINSKANLREPSPIMEIRELVIKLDQELDRRLAHVESHPLYTEATILDPRFKKKSFRNEQCFERALVALKQKVGNATVAPPEVQVPEEQQPSTCSSIWDEFDKEVAQLRPANTTAAGIVEVDKYLAEPILHRTKDPFLWWSERRHVYPLLYKYIQRRLHLVATSVPCERIFSKAGYTMNDRRTQLKSKKLSQLLFISTNK